MGIIFTKTTAPIIKPIIGWWTLYFWKRFIYWELSQIFFWTYYLDLTTQIELEASGGKKKKVPALFFAYAWIVIYVDSREVHLVLSRYLDSASRIRHLIIHRNMLPVLFWNYVKSCIWSTLFQLKKDFVNPPLAFSKHLSDYPCHNID
jgi:hypothetical protein